MKEFLNDENDFYQEEKRIFGYCDHCGFAIESADDAVYVPATGDRVHTDCWEEYAMEHMFDFARLLSSCARFDCGD